MQDQQLLEFIASLFASLTSLLSACAWPSTLLILIVFFRKPIIDALPNLTRLKAAGFEFEFGERLEQVERKADEAQLPPTVEAPQDLVGPEFGRIYALAEINARSAILEAWLLVETAITDAAAQLGVNVTGSLSRSPYSLLKKLRSKASYSQGLISIVDDLRQLRNNAVHDSDFRVSLDETVEYIDLAIRVSSAISKVTEAA